MPITQEQMLQLITEAKAWRHNAKSLYEALRHEVQAVRSARLAGRPLDTGALEALVETWNFPSDTEITYYDRYYQRNARRNLRTRFYMQQKRGTVGASPKVSLAAIQPQPQAFKMPEVVEDALTPEQAERMFGASPEAPDASSGTWPLEELEKFLAEQGDK